MTSENVEMSGSAWVPSEGVTCHTGKPIPSEFDFFVLPPSEIGRVLSAESSLQISAQPISLLNRLIAAVIVSGVIVAIVWIILFLIKFFVPGLSDIAHPLFFGIVGGSAGLLFGVYAFNAFGFNPSCTYVGDQGIAKIHLKGSRQATPLIDLLKFKDAANLYTGQVKHYKNARYRYTTYSYVWILLNGKNWEMKGSHNSSVNQPFDSHPWYFAKSAESAWSNYLLPYVNEQFAQSGYVEFPMSGDPQGVRVGQGFLEFVLKNGSTQRAEVSEMQEISTEGGLFYFTHPNTNWLSNKGRYLVNYSDIPNAQLFMMCLKNLAGISSFSDISFLK